MFKDDGVVMTIVDPYMQGESSKNATMKFVCQIPISTAWSFLTQMLRDRFTSSKSYLVHPNVQSSRPTYMQPYVPRPTP